jgi:hypothetical protein
MRKWVSTGAFAAVTLAGLHWAEPAHAVTPTPAGTIVLSAERMVGASLTFSSRPNTPAYFSTSILASANPAPLQYPRIGFDYFVIPGLSLGGNLGLSYRGDPGETFYWNVIPRVGYAFSLSPTIDLWPRVGVGVVGSSWRNGDGSTSSWSSGVIDLEALFVFHLVPAVALFAGPALDAELATYGSTVVGITGGLAAVF